MKVVVKPPVTVGLCFYSAAFRDISYVSVLIATELTA